MKKISISIIICLLFSLVACVTNKNAISIKDTSVANNTIEISKPALDTSTNSPISVKKEEKEGVYKNSDSSPLSEKVLENLDIIPGRFVIGNGWVVYAKLINHDSGTTALYKMDFATSKSIEICKDNPGGIFTDGEWIYYDKVADDVAESDDVTLDNIEIYKVKPDGTSRSKLLKGADIQGAKDGWIYYRKVELLDGEEGANCLYRMKQDGSNEKQVIKDFMHMQLVGQNIYYLNMDTIIKTNVDGFEPRGICKLDKSFGDTYFQTFFIKDNTIFFTSSDYSEGINKDEGLFRINIDGTDLKNILHANIHDSEFIVFKNKIFYVSVKPQNDNTDKHAIANLYTYTLNEFDSVNNKTKELFNVYNGSLTLIGNYLYYTNNEQKNERLNLDTLK